MKFIRTAWSIILNGLLVILPWFVLALLVLQFGQPLLSQFKKFLGNPIMELEQLSEKVRENPAEPIPYQQFKQQYQQIAVRDVVSDTEKRQLRHTTLNIYQSVVQRTNTTRTDAESTTLSDTFFTFYDNELIPKIFERPELLRNSLRKDLTRIEQATRFPYHPARGLKEFLGHTDRAEDLIRAYGEIYADQLTCQRMAGTDCQYIFETSVDIAADQLGQFFSNWPSFHKNQPNKPGALLEVYERLLATRQSLGEEVSGYLEAPPWKSRHSLRSRRDTFLDNFTSNSRQWYLNILKQTDFPHEQFTGSTPDATNTHLNNLAKLERRISESPPAQQLFRSDQTQAARAELLKRLTTIYHWVRATSQFDPEYSESDRGLNRLTDLIGTLPGGSKTLEEQNQTLRTLTEQYRQLRRHLNRKNYEQLQSVLSDNLKRANQAESPLGWSIMLRQFVRSTADRVTSPDWQPLNQASEDAYSAVIETYGDIGQTMQLRSITSKWVDQAILSMKSRRFNQLKHEILNLVENLTQNNRDTLRQRLKEILELEDLPEQLVDQPKLIVFHSMLIERIKLSDNRLRETFGSLIDANSIRSAHWKSLDTLLRAQENLATSEFLTELDIANYTGEIKSWLNQLQADDPLVVQVKQSMKNRLKQFLRSTHQQVIDLINNPGDRDFSRDELISMVENLNGGVEEANSLSDVNLQINPNQWKNVLVFRQQLDSINAHANNLSKGSLLGSNSAFAKFRDTLNETAFNPWPDDYGASFELQAIRTIHQTVLKRATTIQEKASQDWLAGWGGRISGKDILTPWKTFISQCSNHVDDRDQRAALQQMFQETQSKIEEWSS